MKDFKERIVVVTGGGRGIGAATVKRFYDNNAKGIAIFDYDYETAKSFATKLDPSGKKIIAVKCDVSNSDDVKKAVKETCDIFGKIDILVNNAGITRDAMFHKMTEENWDAVINVNLKGIYYVTKEIIKGMREKSYGRIINISSTSAFGNIGQANYAASKAAVIGFTKTLCKEGGAKNITVNAIAPGFIDTEMLRTVPEKIMEMFLTAIPMNRLGSSDELAAVIEFLASDDASFISGQCITVSGGANT